MKLYLTYLLVFGCFVVVGTIEGNTKELCKNQTKVLIKTCLSAHNL